MNAAILNRFFIVLLSICFTACKEDEAFDFLSCQDFNDFVTATVSEGAISYQFSTGSCDIIFTREVNSFGGDSIVLHGIVALSGPPAGSLAGDEFRSIAFGFNVTSTEEYICGVDNLGNQSAECRYNCSRQISFYSIATTTESGSGLLTIDSLSLDYISGEFEVTGLTSYEFNGIPINHVNITEGSFSKHLIRY